MTRQELRVFLQDHFCGCGSPEAASASLLRLLEAMNVGQDGEREPAYLSLPKWLPDEGAKWLLLYWLDAQDLVEHGGGLESAWLTPKGEAIRDALRAEAADRFEALHEMHCAHGFDVDDAAHSCQAADEAEKGRGGR